MPMSGQVSYFRKIARLLSLQTRFQTERRSAEHWLNWRLWSRCGSRMRAGLENRLVRKLYQCGWREGSLRYSVSIQWWLSCVRNGPLLVRKNQWHLWSVWCKMPRDFASCETIKRWNVEDLWPCSRRGRPNWPFNVSFASFLLFTESFCVCFLFLIIFNCVVKTSWMVRWIQNETRNG